MLLGPVEQGEGEVQLQHSEDDQHKLCDLQAHADLSEVSGWLIFSGGFNNRSPGAFYISRF